MGNVKQKIVDMAEMAEQILDSGVSDKELDEFMGLQLSPEDIEFYHSNKDVIFGIIGWEADDDYDNMDESLMMPRLNEYSFDEQEWLEDDEDEKDEEKSESYEEWLEDVYTKIAVHYDWDVNEDYTKDLFVEHEEELQEIYNDSADIDEAADLIIGYSDEDNEDDGDELSDYEWEVGAHITATFEEDGVEYDEDNLGEVLWDYLEEMRENMRNDVEPQEFAEVLMGMPEFMEKIKVDDMDESIKMPKIHEAKKKECKHDIDPKTGKCKKCGGYFRPY